MLKPLSWRRWSVVAASLAFVFVAASPLPALAVEMTFYGNQHFRFVSNAGKVILINPWIKGDKDFPFGMDFYKKGEVDLILTTSGRNRGKRPGGRWTAGAQGW